MSPVTANILPILVAALATGWLCTVGWRRRSNAAAVWFAALAATACLWATLDLVSYLSGDSAKKVITLARYAPITVLPVAWLLFSAAYSNVTDLVRTRWVAMLMVVPVITIVLVATNHLHGLVFSDATIVERGGLRLTAHTYGPWFWIHTAYSYTLLAGGVALTVVRLRSAVETFRGQAWVMLAGALVPALANVAYLVDPVAMGYTDPTPVAFGVSTVFFGIGLFRYNLLDILPVARNHVFERMHDPVVVFDVTGRILDANMAARRFVGDRGAELVGSIPTEGLYAVAWELRLIDDAVREEEILVDGKHRWFEWSMSPISIGRLLRRRIGRGWLLQVWDITARKHTEAELRDARDRAEELSRLKSAFLSNMNHEFRTPLSGIIGLADVLEDDLSGEHRQYVKLIRQGGERLLATMDSVLAVADLDSGNIHLSLQPVDVCATVTRQVASFRPAAQENHLSLVVEAPDGPVWLQLDQIRFSQALRQVIDNAIKYTDRGRVLVGVNVLDEHIEIYVRDSGRGISETFMPHLFEGFRQESDGHARRFEGAGLGLRIARGLVEQMGGQVLVDSELGKGSTFRFRFLKEPKAQREAVTLRHPPRRVARRGDRYPRPGGV